MYQPNALDGWVAWRGADERWKRRHSSLCQATQRATQHVRVEEREGAEGGTAYPLFLEFKKKKESSGRWTKIILNNAPLDTAHTCRP